MGVAFAHELKEVVPMVAEKTDLCPSRPEWQMPWVTACLETAWQGIRCAGLAEWS